MEDEDITYSVLQTEPVLPTEDQLVAAFRAIDALTDYDAKRRARGTAGYIADRLSHEDAMGLLGGMARQGLAAAIEEDRKIPKLPPPFSTRHLNCTTSGVELYDAMNRPVIVPWGAVTLVACGAVMRTKIKPSGGAWTSEMPGAGHDLVRTGLWAASGSTNPVARTMPSFQFGSNESRESEPTIEIHTLGTPERWVLSGSFRVKVQGERIRPDDEAVHQIACLCAQYATGAVINFGVQEAAERHRLLAYRHHGMFEKELRWLMWLSTL